MRSTRGHGLGAVGQGGDGTRSTQGEHPVHLGNCRGGEHRVGGKPAGSGGEQRITSRTPATRAGTAPMSTLLGYAARPPGAYTPTRASGSGRRSTTTPGSSTSTRLACGRNAECTPGHVPRRALERPAQREGLAVQRRTHDLARHLERDERDPVEPPREVAERRVARAYVPRPRGPPPGTGSPAPGVDLRRARAARRSASGPSAAERTRPSHRGAHGSSLSMRVTRMPSPPERLERGDGAVERGLGDDRVHRDQRTRLVELDDGGPAQAGEHLAHRLEPGARHVGHQVALPAGTEHRGERVLQLARARRRGRRPARAGR